MKVNLAGYNLDQELIKEINSTPETISAAYARISRDPRDVDELRKESINAVDKARKSNETIVYGMGHNSIAEHSVFNIDIIGVSRLLVEEIEKHRLNSYTEKSQRYVLFDKDYYIPYEDLDELEEEHPNIKQEYINLIEKQFSVYKELYEPLRKYFVNRQDLGDMPLAAREGLAKEDARYCISLATTTQLGMTINARNLEYLIRKLNESGLMEAYILANNLYYDASHVAPSLIKYATGDFSKIDMRFKLKNYIEELKVKYEEEKDMILDIENESLCLLNESEMYDNIDDKILSSILLKYSDLWFSDIEGWSIDLLTKDERKRIFNIIFKNISEHDALLREFECVDLKFDMIISASCYAQLKRHRMCTLITQDYDPSLGYIIPESILNGDSKFLDKYHEIMKETTEFYKKLPPTCRNYILTNAHSRRVKMSINLRAFYHFCRLRMDKHAQWEIRNLAHNMCEMVQNNYHESYAIKMLCGKDKFEETKKEVLGEK